MQARGAARFAAAGDELDFGVVNVPQSKAA